MNVIGDLAEISHIKPLKRKSADWFRRVNDSDGQALRAR
jgi:hypothetical protein